MLDKVLLEQTLMSIFILVGRGLWCLWIDATNHVCDAISGSNRTVRHLVWLAFLGLDVAYAWDIQRLSTTSFLIVWKIQLIAEVYFYQGSRTAIWSVCILIWDNLVVRFQLSILLIRRITASIVYLDTVVWGLHAADLKWLLRWWTERQWLMLWFSLRAQ